MKKEESMAGFDAIFFDMDGTLVENSSLMPAAFQKAFANAGFRIEIEPSLLNT